MRSYLSIWVLVGVDVSLWILIGLMGFFRSLFVLMDSNGS